MQTNIPDSQTLTFSKIRRAVWPIHHDELKKFFVDDIDDVFYVIQLHNAA